MYLRKSVGWVTLVQDPEERPAIDILWFYDALRTAHTYFTLQHSLQGSTPNEHWS